MTITSRQDDLLSTGRESKAVGYYRVFVNWTQVRYLTGVLSSTAELSVTITMQVAREFFFTIGEALEARDLFGLFQGEVLVTERI